MMRSRFFKYLVAAYLPGAILPVVHAVIGAEHAYATWIFTTLWIIYLLALLILYYLGEKRVS